ncbi:MAG: hypothetical protein QOD11_2506 [Bradyrhizobium sp.]|nr:hypothetical protein [Bradyrhizobium sp.]
MAGTWTPLTHQPTFSAGTMLLLTDGTVFCQNSNTNQWWKLTPDVSGNYVAGTWSPLANSVPAPPYAQFGPLYFASAVLRDGRVFVAGGEYNMGGGSDILAAEIYNPLTNSWTVLPTPAGWTQIGDAASCVFPDGRVMIGSLADNHCAVYDPVANNWTALANKLNARTNEETWTLLQDQTILTVDCFGHPQTEKYIIAADKWINCGNTPADLVEAASFEIGPALALPDGRIFAVGATGHTALYTMPPNSNQVGTWANGPTFPVVSGKQLGAKDAPACLLPNGLVLCAVGPVDGTAGNFLSPTYFYEFNPANNTLAATANPPTNGGPPYVGRLMLLPSGQVLFANGSNNIQVYTPAGAPDPMWKPNITSVPGTVIRGGTATLYGRQINGLSQAVSYGDDATSATNYPIVRIRNNTSGHVYYCRTSNHSTLAINTGTVVHHTQFTVPAAAELGASTITVVANGIPSDPVPVTVQNFKAKEVKEIKLELKEIDITKTTMASPAATIDADLLAVIHTLAERADQAALAEAQQQSFIQPNERPVVGSVAVDQLPPPSRAEPME